MLACSSLPRLQYNRIYLYHNVVHPVPQLLNLPLIVPALIADAFGDHRCGSCSPCGDFEGGVGAPGQVPALLASESKDAAAAETIHMEAFLKGRREEERSTVKAIATSTRDTTRSMASEQTRGMDLLEEIRTSLAELSNAKSKEPVPSELASHERPAQGSARGRRVPTLQPPGTQGSVWRMGSARSACAASGRTTTDALPEAEQQVYLPLAQNSPSRRYMI